MIRACIRRSATVWFAAGLGIALSGCRVGPQYVRPAAPMAPEFKEALPDNFKSPVAQIFIECRRISYSAESHEFDAPPIAERQFHRELRKAKHAFKFGGRMENRCFRVTPYYGLARG